MANDQSTVSVDEPEVLDETNYVEESVECDSGSDAPEPSQRSSKKTKKELNVMDEFFQKMYYNVLVGLGREFGAAPGLFIGTLSNSKFVPKRFKDYINEKEERYEKWLENQGKDKWIMISDYIGREEISDLVRIFKEDEPKVTEQFYISKNINFIGGLLDLTDTEQLLFQFYAYLDDVEYETERVWDYFTFTSSDPIKQIVTVFNIDPKEAKSIISGSTNLLNSGLLVPLTHTEFQNHYVVMPKVQDLINADGLTHEMIENKLFPSNLDTSLTLDDYHQVEEIEILTGIMNNCLKKKRTGINVLLWGIPGTGKTELPLVLAEKYGWDLRVIGDISDSEDEEKGRAERLLSLKIAQKLFRNQSEKKIVLLFDEMEDLFKLDMNAAFSKAFLNRLIEKTKIPIIWTTNDLDCLGSAVIRRMTYAISFKVPPAKVRKNVWIKYIKQYKLKVSEKVLDDLATDFDVVPALIANAAKVAYLSDLKDETIEKVLSNLDTAMNFGEERRLGRKNEKVYEFEIALSNADLSLENLTQKILSSGNKNFSICLYGPSGTGKSAFARYLAKQLNMKVSFNRASDLQSMWVGECEKNIARMFLDAREGEQFIILDEADTFFYNREQAMRSWEVSQVNEMLSQMETHTYPFICTTNLMDHLDPATLRRFTFKIKFDFLRKDQIVELFQFYFKVDPPLDILDLDILTPGDYANVKNKANFLKITDGDAIHKMLVEEVKFKPQFTNPTGFRFNELRSAEPKKKTKIRKKRVSNASKNRPSDA